MKKTINKPVTEQDLTAFLKETRKQLGLTVEELAEVLETTGRSYRRWENGESDPSGQAIAKVYRLREQNPDIFNPNQPIITVTNLAQQQSSFLEQLTALLGLFKQQETLTQEQHKQQQQYQQQLAKSLQQIQQPQPLNQQQSNQQPQPNQPSQQEIDQLFQLLKKLENRLIFLEDKCGYPYQPSQYNNQYNSDSPNRNYRKRNR